MSFTLNSSSMLKSKCVLNRQLDKGLDESTFVAWIWKHTNHNGCVLPSMHETCWNRSVVEILLAPDGACAPLHESLTAPQHNGEIFWQWPLTRYCVQVIDAFAPRYVQTVSRIVQHRRLPSTSPDTNSWFSNKE